MPAIPANIAAVYPEARIVPSVSRHPETGAITVALDVEGLPCLDRKMAYAWQFGATEGKLATRLVEAIRDGLIYSLEKVATDCFGQTYPVGTCVPGRQIHRELARLGY